MSAKVVPMPQRPPPPDTHTNDAIATARKLLASAEVISEDDMRILRDLRLHERAQAGDVEAIIELLEKNYSDFLPPRRPDV